MTQYEDRDAPLRVSVRELTLVIERVLLLTGLLPGLVPAVRECVLRSQAMRLGGLARLQRCVATLGRPDPAAVIVRQDDGAALRIDAGGLHAWVVGPTLLDLAIARAHRHGGAAVLAEGVADPGELRVLEALAPRQGARVAVAADGPAATIRCTACGLPALLPDDVLHAALQDGVMIDGALWWAMHHLSNQALAPDSAQSRRHAGPIILEPDGSITGRADVDDDTDLTLLGAPARPG